MLDEIGAYLAAQGLGTVKTSSNNPTIWPIYKGGVFPADTPTNKIDDVISVAAGPSDPPIDAMGPTVGAVIAEEDALVVQVRSENYTTAEAKARAAWDKLHKYGNATLGTTRYLYIEARQVPFPIGRDDNGRWIIGFNCSVTKEKS